jgi:hypothetical protein
MVAASWRRFSSGDIILELCFGWRDLWLALKGGGCRGGGPGFWMCAEAAASDSFAVTAVWGLAVALQGMGGVLVLQG